VSGTKRAYWSNLISEQKASGQKARPFCRERGIGEYSFYKWRRRLQQSEPVRFALLATAPAVAHRRDPAFELVLRNGERLRISNQVDAAMLRLVLDAVRR
jgi:hypothetical protein